ncbi:hypothetical protein K7462_30110, partial [Pseudomonas fluorescens]|nr:hypothetical protein [Pseudomonas fluorescens]
MKAIVRKADETVRLQPPASHRYPLSMFRRKKIVKLEEQFEGRKGKTVMESFKGATVHNIPMRAVCVIFYDT